MQNTIKYLSIGSGLAVICFITFMMFSNPDGHACKWPLCPYKGVTRGQAHDAVSNYTGETGTDAYHIDMLHIQYPADSYEELETRLLTAKK